MHRSSVSWGPLLALSVLLSLTAQAGEGMWMPQQIPDLAPTLRELGFDGDTQAFADLTGHPMGAVVSLGGCTATFVSPEGLIATNHHCTLGTLQYNSTPESNLLLNGFLARTKAEELSNGPGSRVWVTSSVREVTDEILGEIDPALGDLERRESIELRVKQTQGQCEETADRCRVASYFGGSRYFETAALEIRDVRLVYAPAEGIGVFGGETDNFRWPRQTGDWAFLRAYVGKNGTPADYSEENVPYQPKHWVKVSPDGANPGDLVFVAGYPGNTARHRTYSEVRQTVEWSLPRRIRRAEEQMEILEELAKQDEELALKVNNPIRMISNGWTYRTGLLQGMTRGGVLEERKEQEEQLAAWIDADPERKAAYGDVLSGLAKIQAEAEKTRDRDAALGSVYFSSSILGSANAAWRLAAERPKPDVEREPGYQERDWENIRNRDTRRQRTMDPRKDRALLRHAILEAAALPESQRIEPLDKAIGLTPDMAQDKRDKAIDRFLDRLYNGTKMFDLEFRQGLLDQSTEQLRKIGDPALGLIIDLDELDLAIEKQQKERAGARSRLRPLYMQALLESRGGLVAPDANGQLRVTYGVVKGVPAQDGVFYTPQTTLAGIEAKQTGEGEFNAPAAELAAIAELRAGKSTPYLDPELGDVPVNFLSDVDTTGGNSGSATLNDRGELCGLLFDGTFESMASDYLFNEKTTRSIHVDSRYMLWVMTEVDGAVNLLEELGLR